METEVLQSICVIGMVSFEMLSMKKVNAWFLFDGEICVNEKRSHVDA